MRVRRILYIVCTTLVLISFQAATSGAGDPTLDAQVVTDMGNVWTALSNFGTWGDPNSVLSSWEWPGGQSSNYLWEGRFWIGAKVDNLPHVSHADYGDYEFHAALDDPLSVAPGTSDEDVVVYFDDELPSPMSHFPLYVRVEESHLSWQAQENQDFMGLELTVINTGNYMLREVYVGLCFDYDVASIDLTEPHIDDLVDYDGEDGPDSDSDRRDWVDPMDLDGDTLTGYDPFGWPWADSLNPLYDPSLVEPDGIYDEYRFWEDPLGPQVLGQPGTIYEGLVLTNASGIPLHGYLLPRGLSCMLDGDNPAVAGDDTGERDLNPPATGFCGTSLLYCPTDSSANPWTHQWWNWNNDPGNDSLKYAYMEGTHPSAAGRRFMPRPNEVGEPVFDYRYLLSCGPYILPPGESMLFVMAFCMGEGLEGIRSSADRALEFYYDGSIWSSPLTPSGPGEDWHWGVPGSSVAISLTPLNPPITVPANGGTFDFNVAIANNLAVPETFDAWIMVTLPNGMQFGPVLGPVNLTLPGGQSINRDRTQSVPGGAPAGLYTYTGYVGDYPVEVLDQDEFTFEKLAVGDGAPVSNWSNTGESLDPWFAESTEIVPTEFEFFDAYPNPFNPTTVLGFQLPVAGWVKLDIFDVNGRNVGASPRACPGSHRGLPLQNWYPPGTHHILFDGSGLPSGIYLARLVAGDLSQTQKLVLMK